MRAGAKLYSLLTALLLGGWIMFYIGLAVLAIEDVFPGLAQIFPPLKTTLVLGLILMWRTYLVERNRQT